MIKSKKQMFIVISVFALVMMLGTVTYAFFNYTRTGSPNNFSVGRIFFKSDNEETITLSNLFPIDPENSTDMADPTKVGTYSIDITGDTDYVDGLEYLVSIVDSNISNLPISIDVSVSNGLGTSNANYFTARESKNASIYKKLIGDTIVGDGMVLVGYVKPNTTSGVIEGVDGTITITAYLDKNKILISDTYDGTESDNMGTTNSMAEGKTVISTADWNALSTNGVSFKVRVEANEGIWVNESLETIMRKTSIMDNVSSGHVLGSSGINFGAVSSYTNGQGLYMRAGTENNDHPIVYYRGEVYDNNVIFANKCWKMVRTTDTGGVKMIYNGETGTVSVPGNIIDRDEYSNLSTPSGLYNFDETDNTWNINITFSAVRPEFTTSLEFTVPAGDNYSITMSATTSGSSGGSYNFYKNGTSIQSGGGGSGNPITGSYEFGSLTANDVIKFFFAASASTENPITIKIKMEQNGEAIEKSNYNIVEKPFVYNQTTKTWSSSVYTNERASATFSVTEAGNYMLNFVHPHEGSLYIFRNQTQLSIQDSSTFVELNNLQPTEVIYILYNQERPDATATISFDISGIKDATGCPSTGNDTMLKVNNDYETAFAGDSYDSPTYVGYMYGTVYKAYSTSWSSSAKFATDAVWDGTTYNLVNADASTPNNTHHYSCNNALSCTNLRYVYNVSGNTKYYIILTNGDKIEDALEKMKTNTTSSIAKTNIDNWYASNLLNYTNKLEDTVWCNDRSFGDGYNSSWFPNGGDISNYLYFGPRERSGWAESTSSVKNQPSLACANKGDRFTVSESNGNGALTYPVGLLTEDEVVLAGGVTAANNSTSYLINNAYWWTMSPSSFLSNNNKIFVVANSGLIYNIESETTFGLRPAISLKPGQIIKSGNGTITDPYVIE